MAVTVPAAVSYIGWIIAFVVLIVAIIMGFMSLLPKEEVMIICAICAIRL